MSALFTTAYPPSTSPARRFLARNPVVAFFGLTYAITWLILFPLAVAVGLGAVSSDAPYIDSLNTLASYGPTIAALVMTGIVAGTAGFRRLILRLVQWRVAVQWYLFVLFGVPLINILGASVVYGWAPLQGLAEMWPTIFTRYLPFVLLTILTAAPLQEEPGWRGFAQPRLMARHGPMVGTLILGVVWSLWHLPNALFFGWGASALMAFLAITTLTAFVYTWVYNNTGGSLLMMVLLHGTINTSTRFVSTLLPAASVPPAVSLLDYQTTGMWIGAMSYGVVVLLLLVFTRGRLSYSPKQDVEG